MPFVYVYLDQHNLNDANRLKLDFVDLNLSSITVDDLKDKLTTDYRDQLPVSYELSFFGRQLKSKNHLSYYGIKTGAYLFVFTNQLNEHQDDQSKEKKIKFEQTELQKMMTPIRTALVNSNFRMMLNRLYDKDFRENIVACTPQLRDNIVAFCR